MAVRLDYLRESYKIIRCLITRKHSITYADNTVRLFNTGEVRIIAHCSKCDRYFL